MNMPKNPREYIIYDVDTDFPVILGTAAECSKFMGISTSTFYSLISKGAKPTKYAIYDLDKLEQGYYLEEGEANG